MSLDGKVAWVSGIEGAGEAIGRAVALALSARGVRVIVSGPVEKVLGAVVGEIAHGGGTARHLVAVGPDAGSAEAAVARALEAFGRLDFVVACGVAPAGRTDADCTFTAARPAIREEGRLIAIAAPAPASADDDPADGERAALAHLVRTTARGVATQRVTCNALFPAAVDGGGIDAAESPLGRALAPEDVAELVVFLCGTGGAVLTGQAIGVGGVGLAPAPALPR